MSCRPHKKWDKGREMMTLMIVTHQQGQQIPNATTVQIMFDLFTRLLFNIPLLASASGFARAIPTITEFTLVIKFISFQVFFYVFITYYLAKSF